MPETNLTRQGIAFIKEGKLVQAAETLELALAQNPDDLQAWIWLSAAVDNDPERLECMQQVLRIDPQHATAQKAVAVLSKKLGVPAEPPPPPPVAAVEWIQPEPEQKISAWEQTLPVEAAPMEEQKAPAWDTMPLESTPAEQTPPDWSVTLGSTESELAAWQTAAPEDHRQDLSPTDFTAELVSDGAVSESDAPETAAAAAAAGLESLWMMGAPQQPMPPAEGQAGWQPDPLQPAPSSEPGVPDWAEGLMGGTSAAPVTGESPNWAADIFAASAPVVGAETPAENTGETDWLTDFASATPDSSLVAETPAASQGNENSADWFIQSKDETSAPIANEAESFQPEAEWDPNVMASLRGEERVAPVKGVEATPAESIAPDWLTEELVENEDDNGFVEVLPPLETDMPEKPAAKPAKAQKKKKKRSPLTFILQMTVLVILLGLILTLAFLLVTQPQAVMDTVTELFQTLGLR